MYAVDFLHRSYTNPMATQPFVKICGVTRRAQPRKRFRPVNRSGLQLGVVRFACTDLTQALDQLPRIGNRKCIPACSKNFGETTRPCRQNGAAGRNRLADLQSETLVLTRIHERIRLRIEGGKIVVIDSTRCHNLVPNTKGS